MSTQELLDNPIWNALTTEHHHLALGTGNARRYPPEIGPLSGVVDHSAESYEDLRALAGHNGAVVLFHQEPQPTPPGWTLVREALMDQMICLDPIEAQSGSLQADAELRPLTQSNAPAMVELAKLTEPGPFALRTMELGAFFGIFHGERLVAMAGQRTRVPGFVEVSAVCTHPDARGRGYARILITAVNEEIRQAGRIPYLHSLAANTSAIAVYRSLGFTLRRNLYLQVLRNEA
jgi:ribosomal protein S18 acetylase RimI-like enzyme